jgi:hypothetical protein
MLTEDEWRLVKARVDGECWDEIATLFGIEPDAARMRFARILQRLKDILDP